MIQKLTTTVMLLGIMLLLTGALFAQGQDMKALAQAALEQTDNLIDYADPLIRAANAPMAVQTFGAAKDFQARAWDAFRRDDLAGYRLAYRFTGQARELIQKALADSRVNGNENQDGTVQRRLERAEERLELAQQAIANEGLPRLESLYGAARNNLDRAWEFFRGEQYRPALKLADQVEKTAKRILDAANSADRFKEQFDRRSSGVAELVAQASAGAATCTSADGKAAAEMASRTYDLARDLSAEGKAQQALTALQNARELALRSIRACSGTTGDVARLRGRYESLRNELARQTEQAASMTGDLARQARLLLDQGRELLAEARVELDANQLHDAEASLQAAHLAISKARDYIGSTR